MEKNSSFLQIFLAIAAVVLLLVAGAGLFWFYQTKVVVKPEEVSTTATPTEIEALPSPTPLPPTPTGGQAVSDLGQVRQAFAEKYNKPLADVNVTIENNTGEFANGGVSFEGEMGGGWWLAAKVDGQWVIVADGNGTVMCADIEGYDFPTSMVPECWDETTSTLISR